MPTLPTRDSLSPVVPSASRQVPHASDMGAVGAGMHALGAAIAGIGHEERQRTDGLELIKAEAEHRKGLNDLNRAFQEDTDYGTYDQRYQQGAAELSKRSSSLISNPELREKFAAKSGMESETVRDRILDRGLKLKREDQLGSLDDALKTHLNIFTDDRADDGQRQTAKNSIRDSLTVAQRSGILTPMQARRMMDDSLGHAYKYDVRRRLANGEDFDKIATDIRGSGGGKKDVLSEIAFMETGKRDVTRGVANISPDSAGSKSYGNLGLNTGGSIQQFVKENNGAQWGLTAKPGTAEFDQQWRDAAKTPGVAEEINDAERAWIDTHYSPRIVGDLNKAGVPNDIANDDRVKAYFTDRMIQQGPGSTANHSKRVAEAAKEANGDPAEFLTAMSKLDRENLRGDFHTAIRTVPRSQDRGRYIGGLSNRVGRREEAFRSMGETGAPGPYSDMSVGQRSELLSQVTTQYREQVKEDINSASERIKETGQMPVDARGRTALDRARTVLDNNQFTKEKLKLVAADAHYQAVSPLPEMSLGQGDAWVDSLNPIYHAEGQKYPIGSIDPEKNFDIAHKTFTAAEERWKKERELMQRDPALSVTKSREISAVMDQVSKFNGKINNTQINEMAVEARMAAQRRRGLSDDQLRVVTVSEAKQLIKLPNRPTDDEVDKAMKDALPVAQKVYGKHASRALTDAIRVFMSENDRDKALGNVSSDVLSEAKPKTLVDKAFSMFSSAKPEAAKITWDTADPKKREEALAWAMQDPAARAGAMDRMFGAGSFAKAVAERAMGKK